MLKECMEGLDIRPDGLYVDLTVGGGGHSRAIMERLSPDGRLIGFDQDSDVKGNLPADERFTFVHGNFRYLENFMDYYGLTGRVNGLLADLGVSSHHFDEAERGFSFRFDGPLDMRMNRASSLTAETVVNDYPEERLADVLYCYGEVERSRAIARAVCKARAKGRLTSIFALRDTLLPFARRDEKKELARVFQALRIEVNDEMGALRQMLESCQRVLAPGARLCVITYHSLEDRLVKNYMKAGNFNGEARQDFFGNRQAPFRPVGKLRAPTEQEITENPRARSGKLRVATRV